MRSPQQGRELKQVGKAQNHRTNSKNTRTANQSGTGFLLLNTALKPLYVNSQADRPADSMTKISIRRKTTWSRSRQHL